MSKDKDKQDPLTHAIACLAKEISEQTRAINALTRELVKKPRVFVLQFGADIPINQKESK